MPRQAETSAVQSQAKPKRPILALSGLCNDAADHVARARLALFDEKVDTEAAMNQLDDAITLLKSVVAASKSVLKDNEASLKKSA
ncbi:hypothetical protein [Methyloligella solikamskensis]|uniref:Uncharacterized protein n=1 Tax=Methyloligella solikamskensis TaxID=1177756 RepID=A0ABW3J8U2_9HYPH